MNITVVISAIAALSWLIVVGLVVVTVLRATRGQKYNNFISMVVMAVVLALVLNIVSAGLIFVEPQERGVVISAIRDGIRDEALQPGLSWIVPYAENVIPYSISRQTYTMSIAPTEGQITGDDSVEARTKDGQVVLVDASLIFAINPTKTVDIHINWQDNYVDNLVRPQSRGVIRDAVSQFNVSEVYSTKRLELINQMTAEMSDILEKEGFILVDFVLRNIAFSDEYAASIEQKQIAEQQAQRAALIVEQRKQEAEQARQTAEGLADANVIEAQGRANARLVEAEAEAEALQLLAEAIANNPDLLTYEYITRLSPGIQVMLVPNDNPLLLPLPELQNDTETTTVTAPTVTIPETVEEEPVVEPTEEPAEETTP